MTQYYLDARQKFLATNMICFFFLVDMLLLLLFFLKFLNLGKHSLLMTLD